MINLNIAGFIEESIVDGERVRSVVFVSGCKHCCKNCHNKETWDFEYGKEFTKEEQKKIALRVKNNPLITGLTISGGDPMYSYKEVIEFIKLYKSYNPTHDIWLYTGFTIEEIENCEMKEIFEHIDYLVDGLYEDDKKDISLPFKGSSNQRIYKIR